MGGLVARYALEKLGIPPGVQIELCALVATPHLGAPIALQNVLGLRPEIFLTGPQCRAALRNPAFPSAYQLLPRSGVPTLLEASVDSGFVVDDLFDPALVAQMGLVAGSLAANATLGTDLPWIGPHFEPPCRYIAIAGNAQKTVTANYLNRQTGARPVEEATAGDGTVPLWSAAPPGIPVRYVPAAHADMFADGDAVAMLQAVLKPDAPGARLFALEAGPAVLSVHALQPSVAAAEPFVVAVIADRPTDSIKAVLEITRVYDGGRTEEQEVPLRYTGGFLRSIPMDFVAPNERAVLQFRVRQKGLVPSRSDAASVLVVK
jgi:phospholipase A1